MAAAVEGQKTYGESRYACSYDRPDGTRGKHIVTLHEGYSTIDDIQRILEVNLGHRIENLKYVRKELA